MSSLFLVLQPLKSNNSFYIEVIILMLQMIKLKEFVLTT